MKKYFALVLLGLVACAPDPTMPLKVATPPPHDPPINDERQRVSIELIGVFSDTLAYASKRGVYLIKDKETGKEYLGVSGIGISELGSHSKGAADER